MSNNLAFLLHMVCGFISSMILIFVPLGLVINFSPLFLPVVALGYALFYVLSGVSADYFVSKINLTPRGRK